MGIFGKILNENEELKLMFEEVEKMFEKLELEEKKKGYEKAAHEYDIVVERIRNIKIFGGSNLIDEKIEIEKEIEELINKVAFKYHTSNNEVRRIYTKDALFVELAGDMSLQIKGELPGYLEAKKNYENMICTLKKQEFEDLFIQDNFAIDKHQNAACDKFSEIISLLKRKAELNVLLKQNAPNVTIRE